MSLPNNLTSLFNRIAFKKEQLQELIIDKFYNKISDTTFEAVILSEPSTQSQVNQTGDAEGNVVKDSKEKAHYIFLRVRPTQIQQYILPNPFELTDDLTRKKVINAHPLAALDVANSAPRQPSWGQVWQCRFTAPGYSGIVLEKFLRVSDEIVEIITSTGEKQSLTPDDVWAGSEVVGDYTPDPVSFDREILEIEHSLPPVDFVWVLGVGYPQVTAQAQKEMDWWKGKKETDNRGNDQAQKDKLQSYWDYANASWGREKGWPWSAVYISYILRGSSFKAGTAHTTYAKANKDSGTWQSFSIKKNKDKIPIQVGDVLIKPRYGGRSSWSSSHGDVIYKIEGNKAMASGGNVSGKAKLAKTFQLSEDGSLADAGKYVVILKKMR